MTPTANKKTQELVSERTDVVVGGGQHQWRVAVEVLTVGIAAVYQQRQ